MNICPECKQRTVDFDDYFNRYRCFNASCRWIQMPLVELERWLQSMKDQAQECPCEVSKSSKMVYDKNKDMFVLFLRATQAPGFEIPDADGDWSWLFSRDSRCIVGIGVFRVTQKDPTRLASKIVAKTEWFEKKLRESNATPSVRRLTRFTIEKLQREQPQEVSKTEQTELATQFSRLISSFSLEKRQTFAMQSC